jgi:elongation factor Ts
MSITAEMVKTLRERTGAGMMDCKRALSEAQGDMDKAVELLRKKGLAQAQKKAARTASEGLIGSYVHMDRIGVLLEVNCETDFVARTEDFRALVKDLAMHIAAAAPQYIRPQDVPQEVLDKEQEVYRAQIKDKPEHVQEKILQGRLEKFFSEVCLMRQVFVKDPQQKQTVQDLVNSMIAKLGENIVVRRFVRFQLGETSQE